MSDIIKNQVTVNNDNKSFSHIVVCNDMGEFVKSVYSKKCSICFGDGYVYKSNLKKEDCPKCFGNGEVFNYS